MYHRFPDDLDLDVAALYAKSLINPMKRRFSALTTRRTRCTALRRRRGTTDGIAYAATGRIEEASQWKHTEREKFQHALTQVPVGRSSSTILDLHCICSGRGTRVPLPSSCGNVEGAFRHLRRAISSRFIDNLPYDEPSRHAYRVEEAGCTPEYMQRAAGAAAGG